MYNKFGTRVCIDMNVKILSVDNKISMLFCDKYYEAGVDEACVRIFGFLWIIFCVLTYVFTTKCKKTI